MLPLFIVDAYRIMTMYTVCMAYLANIQHTSNLLVPPISDPAVVVVMNMIDLTASDARAEMLSNHRQMSSRTFNDFSLRCTRKLQMRALTAFPATVYSFPFLACHSAVILSRGFAGIL